MKKRSARPGDRRDHERRFSERQIARGDDDENLATREGRPMRLPLADDSAEEVAEEVAGNALAEGIASTLDALRPHLRAILIGLAGLFLAAVGWMWARQQEAARLQRSWDDYLAAIQPVDQGALADVATQHAGTPAGRWAELIQAEILLDEGADLKFVDRVKAGERLQSAVDGYAALLTGREKGLLAERATFGLAKANESLGNIDEARRGYEAVAADYPDGAVADMARQRAKALAGDRAREWYGWFESRKLTPPAAPPIDDSPILGVPSTDLPGADSTPSASEQSPPSEGADAPQEPAADAAATPPPQE